MTSTLGYHYETMGRVLAFLVDRGLSTTDLSARNAMEIMTERRGDEADVLKTFADVLKWMLNEDIIRVRKLSESIGGGAYIFLGVQLTAKGIALVSAPHDSELGGSIESKVTKAEGKKLDPSIYAKIGELAGGFAGGFTKSISSG
jgi:hypothetical protein